MTRQRTQIRVLHEDPRIQSLRAEGYVVMKQASYNALRRRKEQAESRAMWAERDSEGSREWARDCLKEERRLRERLTFLATLAMKFGATTEDLCPGVDLTGAHVIPIPLPRD